jgi:hypothetical protein
VAAGRERDPFAPRTTATLRSLEPGGPTRDDVVGRSSRSCFDRRRRHRPDFDDFHLAAGRRRSPITRRIVARAPERLTIVFASRRGRLSR